MHTNNLRKLARETNDGVLRGPALGAADEIDRLHVEIERLTKERDYKQSVIEKLSVHIEKVEAERDEERYARDTLLRERSILKRKLGVATARAELAEAERDEARSMLADAERDMRQRAADLCDCACMDGIGDEIRAIGDAILALPLKHADREGGK